MSEANFDKLQEAKVFKNVPNPNDRFYMAESIIKRIFPRQHEQLYLAIEHLEKQGVEHDDFHLGNCFIDTDNLLGIVEEQRDLDIYMIDFGDIEIDPQKIEVCYPELNHFLSQLSRER